MNMVVSHWSANAVALTLVLLVAAVHMRGTRAIAAGARRRGEAAPGPALAAAPGGPAQEGAPGGPAREAALFHAGLLVLLLALVSPIGYWSQRYIWVRSVQDLLLANVAPALIVLGGPWLALRRGLALPRAAALTAPARTAPAPTAADKTAAPPRPARDWPRGPLAVVIGFNLVWCGWHVPVLYDAALRQPAVYAAEIVCYAGLGVAFWLQLIGSRPASPVLAPLRRAGLLVATVVVGSLLGMVLVFGYGLAYPGYLQAGRHVISVVYDQQVGGAVLWVLALPAYATAGIALLIRWLNDEEAGALTAGFGRLLKPDKPAWPSRPGLR